MKVKLALGLVAVGAVVALAASAFHESQRADFGWSPSLSTPTYTSAHPRVVIDEAHHNASTGSFPGRYWPFARLLRADGYRVSSGKQPFSEAGLSSVDVLVIVNASGAAHPQVLGINLPVPVKGKRGDPAFTPAEIRAVTHWVEQGGSLLLVADHAPFGSAADSMGGAFGIRSGKGFVEAKDESSDPLVFSRENGRLGDHPILDGTDPGTAVGRVWTFTGQSLTGPAASSVLLRLPTDAVEWVPADTGMVAQPAGPAQGLALSWGRGRVVMLGEAAMLTAQVSRGKPFGLNLTGNDNSAFALNVLHWLSRKL